MSNKYIKVSTYAKEVNMTRAGVYAKIKRGELPFKKIDGITFIRINK